MPLEQVIATEIKHGDIIHGPDGKSTVTCIQDGGHLLKFDFAEGKGNRCWSAVPKNCIIGRYRKTDCPIPCGFAVDHKGEVVESYIGEVHDGGIILMITRTDATTSKLRKKDIHHISGNFNMLF